MPFRECERQTPLRTKVEFINQLSIENIMTQKNEGIEQSNSKFWLGQFFLTKEARHVLGFEDILIALKRHKTGDWGDLCADDKELNDRALDNGGRIFSAYHDRNGVKFWIITEADRSATTVLLPDDY